MVVAISPPCPCVFPGWERGPVARIRELVDDPAPRHGRLPRHDELLVNRECLRDPRSQPEQALGFGARQPARLRVRPQNSIEGNLRRRARFDDAEAVVARVELKLGPPKDRVRQRDVLFGGCGGETRRHLLRRRPPLPRMTTGTGPPVPTPARPPSPSGRAARTSGVPTFVTGCLIVPVQISSHASALTTPRTEECTDPRDRPGCVRLHRKFARSGDAQPDRGDQQCWKACWWTEQSLATDAQCASAAPPVRMRGPSPTRARRRSASKRPPGAARSAGGFCLSFCLIHPRPGPVRGVHGPPFPPGHVRSGTTLNARAQSSKACEGATLPWVQIPPPPLLTWKDADPCGT